MWTHKYFILVTFSIVASGEPKKSVGRMEARLDFFLLINIEKEQQRAQHRPLGNT